MINHWILSKSNTTSTREAGTDTLPEQLSLSSSSGVRATQYLVFCVVFVSTSFCRVVFFLLILLYIRLRITPLITSMVYSNLSYSEYVHYNQHGEWLTRNQDNVS
jgi:hypothetical protein